MAAVCSLVTFGVYQALVLPISEMGMTPHRAYRTVGLNAAVVGGTKNVEFKLLLVGNPCQASGITLIRFTYKRYGTAIHAARPT